MIMMITYISDTPRPEGLILTHIFLGRPEKPITMDVCVNQSPVAPGLSRCFIKPNCKMWVKDRPGRRGLESLLHRNSAYLCKRAALASSQDTLGAIDKCPVLIQSCRTSNVLSTMLRAAIKSACRVEWQL